MVADEASRPPEEGSNGMIPAFRVGERQMRFHPQTVIAKLAADAGVNRAVIEASLGLSPSVHHGKGRI
jgi:hypothetical protein